jgi:hypothetical protein
LLLLCGCEVNPQATLPDAAGRPEIRGTVRDARGPVAGAVVREQTTTNQTSTDRQGQFVLIASTEDEPVTVSAWKHGYYCAKVEGVLPPADRVSLTLRPYQADDNAEYEWVPPVGEESCASCKPAVTAVWMNNAHANATTNPRFLTLYNGTDLDGRQSPPTRYGSDPDYGVFPLPPDPARPYYGPGYKLDFPDTAGNCAACHVPGAAVDTPYEIDPNRVAGADAFGVHCDFCHKVVSVSLDPETGLPAANRPGVLSMELRRPFPDDPERPQLFFGTFDDDNVPEEDTYLPLLETSQFCAPCHFGVFWDVVIYNSFGEWLDSPYSDPETGKTCQQCHMPSPTRVDGRLITNVAPGRGGVERDPLTIHAHTQPGASSQSLLENTVTMQVAARCRADGIVVQVDITNDQAGHHVPTDSPLRHLILVVRATDGRGRPLTQAGGPTVPSWCGVGDPEDGCYAGLPGKAFAKVLEELWTGVSPTGAYWNPTRVVSDNRIPALATDSSTYRFDLPSEAPATVRVTLLFRRAFYDLARSKGWDLPDRIMEETTVTVPPP